MPHEIVSLRRFNWATSFQTWKLDEWIDGAIDITEFQLGHVFSDMEIVKDENDWSASSTVSIGPRLFRHGNALIIVIAHDRPVHGFQLGHVFSDMEIGNN